MTSKNEGCCGPEHLRTTKRNAVPEWTENNKRNDIVGHVLDVLTVLVSFQIVFWF